jgi:catechol O-methyltransferase
MCRFLLVRRRTRSAASAPRWVCPRTRRSTWSFSTTTSRAPTHSPPACARLTDAPRRLYTVDVKLLESLRLLTLHSALVADNVIKPGNPPYLAYVRAPPALKRRALSQHTSVLALAPELAARHLPQLELSAEEEARERSMSTGYEGREQAVKVREGEEGEWRWVYESELRLSWDPYTAERDGVEVSVIVGREE